MPRDLLEQIINGEYEESAIRLKREFTLRSAELIESFNRKYSNTILVKEKCKDEDEMDSEEDCECEDPNNCECEDAELEEGVQSVQSELDYFMAINESVTSERDKKNRNAVGKLISIKNEKTGDWEYAYIVDFPKGREMKVEFKKSGKVVTFPDYIDLEYHFITEGLTEGYNQKEYRYYVVSGNKIMSGWEYKEDAEEERKDNMPEKHKAGAKVYTKLTLVAKDLDPADDKNWYTLDEGKTIKDTLLGKISEDNIEVPELTEELILMFNEEAAATNSQYKVWSVQTRSKHFYPIV